MTNLQKVHDTGVWGKIRHKYLLGLFLLYGEMAFASDYWGSFTFDNDLFVGEDSGYTNGVYFSFYDVYQQGDPIRKPDIMVRPLMWSMPTGPTYGVANVYSFGQVMTTPEDLTLVDPPADSVPYSALLNLTNTYITVGSYYVDWVSTSLGIVGPAAKGKESQKAVHKAIGAKQPMGWDTQLNNEVVFGFTRGRAFRVLATSSDTMDLLSGGSVSVGTLKSGLDVGLMMRVGRNLSDSYATVLLSGSRTSNPIAVNSGWFVYAGITHNYYFNLIYLDGNTYRDSRSIDYDHSLSVFTAGATYALTQGAALTFAYSSPVFSDHDEKSREIERLTRYGTLTLAWRI